MKRTAVSSTGSVSLHPAISVVIPIRSTVAPSNSPVFDEMYLTRLRNGDDDTAEHFSRHFRRVLRLQFWRKFTPEREEELIEQVMATAIQNILAGQPREAARLPGYIHGISANIIRREMRFRREVATDTGWDRLLDKSRTPEETLAAKETARAVQETLGAMAARDREVLVDLFLRDIDRDEVCQKHTITRGQLRSVLFRARERFQKIWQTPK